MVVLKMTNSVYHTFFQNYFPPNKMGREFSGVGDGVALFDLRGIVVIKELFHCLDTRIHFVQILIYSLRRCVIVISVVGVTG